MSGLDDGRFPNEAPMSLAKSLLWDAGFIALGMGLVSFAFYARWVDTGELSHPFPIFLFFGVPIIFFATRRFVRTLVAHIRAKRR